MCKFCFSHMSFIAIVHINNHVLRYVCINTRTLLPFFILHNNTRCRVEKTMFNFWFMSSSPSISPQLPIGLLTQELECILENSHRCSGHSLNTLRRRSWEPTGPGHPSGQTMGHDLPQGSVFQDKLLFRMCFPLRINASVCLCLLSPKLSMCERKQGKNGNSVQPVSNIAQTGNKRRLQWAGPLKCPLSKQNHSHIWFPYSKSTRVICPLWYEAENKEVTSQVAQWWRIRLPMQEMRETRVQALAWEDPLKEEMATHSSTITWKIPQTEEPGGLQTMGLQRVRHHWATEHTAQKTDRRFRRSFAKDSRHYIPLAATGPNLLVTQTPDNCGIHWDGRLSSRRSGISKEGLLQRSLQEYFWGC